MPLDSLSFTAPTRLRALLCPLGRIKRSRFSNFTSRLSTSNVVRLGDVTPDPQRTMFSPQGFPDGQIVYDLTNSLDREHEYLETFEVYRRTFVIIALADHTEGNDPDALVSQFEELKFLYPGALHYVCLMFDAPADGAVPQGKDPNTFIPVPTRRPSVVSVTAPMRTVMADITGPVLGELCSFAKTLQALPTLDSPLSPEARTAVGGDGRRMSVPAGGGLQVFEERTSLAKKRTTMAGFGGGSSDRSRNKGKGRVVIAVAQLHLLAGRIPDALKEFIEGADVCRANNDHLWHGKALEGIGVCLVILAHLKVPFQIPQIPYPAVDSTKSSKSSPANSKPSTPIPAANGNDGQLHSATSQQVLDILPELHTTIINLYQRASNFPGESIPQICYCEAILRHAKAMTSMHLSNGNADAAIAHMVLGKPLNSSGPRKNIPSRVDISATAMRAYPNPLESMTVLGATKVLSGIASVLGAVGLNRRKALITRELIKILIPGLIQARVVGAAEVGVHPAAGLSALSGSSPLDLGEGDIESGIMELLDDLCRAYGILPGLAHAVPPSAPAPGETPRTADATAAVIAEQEIRSFGWPALKIHVLRNCTSLCEALPDFMGVLKFTTQLLRMADMDLTKEEQIRLSTTISRTVGAARKLGLHDVEADYWDQFLLRDVELLENSIWRAPVPHGAEELRDAGPPTAPIVVDKNPFIYNPAAAAAAVTRTAEPLLVAGEQAEFRVTLQNPFEFELEVEKVTLDVTGMDIVVEPARGVVLAPFRTFQFSVHATPNSTGEIRISGARIKVFGCRERAFPIFAEGLDARERDTKTKRYGLQAAELRTERPISVLSPQAGSRASLRPPPVLHPIPRALNLTVVTPQPLLVVRNTSLSQGALMILEGERRVFQITFANLSSVEVDLLVFSFEDSTTARIQQALVEKGNSPAEMYELELMLAKKRAFVWHRSVDEPEHAGPRRTVFVPANGTATFEVSVLGKPGLTNGTVQADYSHLGRPRSEVDRRFFTRQVIFPVTVTVNASIELARVDFVPFSPSDIASSPPPEAAFGPFKQLYADKNPGDYCLLLLDLRNVWPQPLAIKLTLAEYTAEDTIQAGHTTRLILPVRRIFHSNPTAPIPSVSASQRQFVVSSTKVSLEQERQGREAFWYREALLDGLTGTWSELGSSRSGDIELRGLRLSPRMVETLRIEDVAISCSVLVSNSSDSGENSGDNSEETSDDNGGVTSGDSDAAIQLSPHKFLVPTDTFQTLTTTITNRTARRLRPLFRLLPSLRGQPSPQALELGRRFCVNGLLQQALPPLEPGETRVIEKGFVALARGEYEISASVEEVGAGGKGGAGVVEEMDLQGRVRDMLNGGEGGAPQGGRRCWVCREVLVVVARELDE
ncbi:TRAPP II complex [Geopyxis carbonaria]|nr:TRAPP II complex [Geopyxis carbonaria]